MSIALWLLGVLALMVLARWWMNRCVSSMFDSFERDIDPPENVQ